MGCYKLPRYRERAPICRYKLPRYRESAQRLWQEMIEATGRTFDLDLSELRGLPSRLFPSLPSPLSLHTPWAR